MSRIRVFNSNEYLNSQINVTSNEFQKAINKLNISEYIYPLRSSAVIWPSPVLSSLLKALDIIAFLALLIGGYNMKKVLYLRLSS